MSEEMQVFKPLERFIGHRVLFEKSEELSFTFNNFQIDLESYLNVAVIYDDNDNLHRLFIPTFGLDGLIITGTDIYDTIIEVNSTHHNWLICCDESRPYSEV